MKIPFLIFLCSFIFISEINAQNGSAYSRYGIGDIDYGYSPKMLSIGDLGVTQLDPNHIIISNPASWAAFYDTRIEMSIGYKGIKISNNVDNNFTSETEFKGFTIGIPVSTEYGVGVALGLVPYSSVSYKSVNNVNSSDPNIPSYQTTYEGKGGLSKLFIGSSVKLPLGILAGATLDYYFGNLRYYSNIDFINSPSNINTIYQNDHLATGFGSTVGLISPNLAAATDLKLFSDFRLGVSLNYISDLNADTILTAASLSLIDTISYSSTKMSIPLRISSGMSFVIDDMYRINLDYAYQDWSNYKFAGVTSPDLRNSQKFSTAFEFTPKRKAGMSVWEQIIWRGGISYEQTQYKFNGKGIDEYSVFSGLSFPMGIENSIDLGIQYALRGTAEDNLLKENFIKCYLGISFGELWFLRYEK